MCTLYTSRTQRQLSHVHVHGFMRWHRWVRQNDLRTQFHIVQRWKYADGDFFSVWLFLAGENKRLLDLLWHNIAIDKAILIYFILFIDSKRQREREQGTWSSLQRSQVDSVETGKLFYGTYHVIEKFTSFALSLEIVCHLMKTMTKWLHIIIKL